MTATRTKINLPKVEPFFPPDMAEAGRRVDKVLAQLAHDASVINADGAAGLAAHLADHANPHVVTKAQVGLSLVENTALSTWAGSANIATVGTITSGIWHGTPIAAAYLGAHTHPWSDITSTPTTLLGYGITDAYTKTASDARFAPISHTHAAGDVISGTFADARIAQSNVTQHQAALAIAYTQLTYSALTTGAVLRATGATTAAFGAVDLANASAVTGSLPWANVNKTGSSLADLTTRSAADLSSGVLVDARVQQSNVTQHQAALAIAYSQMTGIVPTWNQNTTGSAAQWTTARNLAGNSVDGSGNVAFANKFIVQGTVDAGLSGAQFLGALGTGIVKNTTTTGVLSIAIAADFPTLNQNTSGSAASLSAALAYNRLPTGGGTWANGGDLTLTGGSLGVGGAPGALLDVMGLIASTPTLKVRGTDTATFFALQAALGAADGGSVGARMVMSDAGTSGVRWDISNGGAAAGVLSFTQQTASAIVMQMTSSVVTLAADLKFTDATYDIGKSGATRPRDGFFSRNLTVGGTGVFTGTLDSGALTVTTSSTVQSIFNSTNVDGGSQRFQKSGVTYGFIGYPDALTASGGAGLAIRTVDALYFAIGSSTVNFLMDTPGNFTAAGSVKTGAPSSGTAKPWKFGQAAVVSPTAPNRTIELDVDGTIYYLAAKTTNN